jgi:hypothetical protein
MKLELRRLIVMLTLVVFCLGLAACGGDGGDTVTGDSPNGVPIDSSLEDEANEAGGVPLGGSGVEDGELPPDESLTDGQ